MSINIEKDKEITCFTTFGIPVKTKYFAEYSNERELLKISRSDEFLNNEVLHIGGGSNLLFLHDYDGLVLHSAIKGITIYKKNESEIFVIAGAGEKWTDFVDRCIEENLAGLENLAGIPGEVGASAIQNVGAYGVEAADFMHAVECFDTVTRKTIRFTKEECRFGYRDSRFKLEERGRYIVLRVSFRLEKSEFARNLEYGPLKEFAIKHDGHPTLRQTADEIIRIRNSKLPDPAEIGSAGSFFKNPVISESLHKAAESVSGETIPSYPAGDGLVKLSAAWLIDHAGMKGVTVGGAVVYEKQPLVIANLGNASAEDVVRLADKVRRSVRNKYLVTLRPEVNYIDTRIKVTILGSGTSKGVPEIGCECHVCQSKDQRDKRFRASALIETHGLRLLIDPSPDFRMQALHNGLYDLDAVLVTHSHYDHVGGIDDLRPFCADRHLPVYARNDVAEDFHHRIDYCFRDHLYPGVPTFDLRIISDKDFFIDGLRVTPVEVMHGKLPIFGYRIGKFGYITDAKTISEEELDKLRGLDVLVVNALRDKEHFAHMSLKEALELINNLKPGKAYLTHFSHEIGTHVELSSRLPENVFPAYDNLTFTIGKFFNKNKY